MAKRLVPASSRPLAALVLLGALCACASTSAERPTAQPAGWRIVERTGEARHLPPATAAWLSATIGEALADGSEVSTGRGARLIVDAPGRNISVGPNSRFVLPGSDGDDLLDQRAGSLRYRVAEAAEPLHIHTRSLELGCWQAWSTCTSTTSQPRSPSRKVRCGRPLRMACARPR
jgi:hypothetical protein